MYQWIFKKYSSVSTNDPSEEGENFQFFIFLGGYVKQGIILFLGGYVKQGIILGGYNVAGVQSMRYTSGDCLHLAHVSNIFLCMFDSPNTFLPPILFTN